LRPRNFAFAAYAACLEPSHHVHDRRAFERATLRRRLLRLGPPRPRKFLGISGSVAVARRQHLRYGDLSNTVRRLSHSALSMVRRRTPWRNGRPRSSHRLRADEHRRHPRGGDLVALAFLFAL